MSATEAYRNLPPEWEGIIPTRVFFDEAVRIVQKAGDSKVTLRAMGGVGIALHSPNERDFAVRLGRLTVGKQEFTDLDFAALFKERGKIVEFFKTLNYEKRPTTIATSISQRQIYFHPQGYFTVDVLMDKLKVANHPIDFHDRLSIDPLTLSLADLLLEKIQMWVAFSEKDLKDCLVLLKAHAVSEKSGEPESIDSSYISKLLSDDWGFYYTATSNLKKILDIVTNLDNLGKEANIDPSNVTPSERTEIATKVDALLKAIEAHPKSLGWKLRSKIGTAKQWYVPVETQSTVGDFGLWRLREVKGN